MQDLTPISFFSRKDYQRLIFENVIYKGKGFFSTQLFKNVNTSYLIENLFCSNYIFTSDVTKCFSTPQLNHKYNNSFSKCILIQLHEGSEMQLPPRLQSLQNLQSLRSPLSTNANLRLYNYFFIYRIPPQIALHSFHNALKMLHKAPLNYLLLNLLLELTLNYLMLNLLLELTQIPSNPKNFILNTGRDCLEVDILLNMIKNTRDKTIMSLDRSWLTHCLDLLIESSFTLLEDLMRLQDATIRISFSIRCCIFARHAYLSSEIKISNEFSLIASYSYFSKLLEKSTALDVKLKFKFLDNSLELFLNNIVSYLIAYRANFNHNFSITANSTLEMPFLSFMILNISIFSGNRKNKNEKRCLIYLVNTLPNDNFSSFHEQNDSRTTQKRLQINSGSTVETSSRGRCHHGGPRLRSSWSHFNGLNWYFLGSTSSLSTRQTLEERMKEDLNFKEDKEEHYYYLSSSSYIISSINVHIHTKFIFTPFIYILYFSDVICLFRKYAYSIFILMNYIFDFPTDSFQKNFGLSPNLKIGPMYYSLDHLKKMNHYTYSVRVCGLTLVQNNWHLLHFVRKCRFSPFILIKIIRIFINSIALRSYLCYKLINDIEKNPGPPLGPGSLTVVTLNCRGLNKTAKVRLLLNKVSAMQSLRPNLIFMLQETMVTNTNYIDIAWRGKYIFTPGTGNSKGCITLLNNNILIHSSNNLGYRGHQAQIELPDQKQIMILNIYAPNGYAHEKKVFFEELVALINNSNLHNVILAGDFNLTFQDCDRLNRQTNSGERNIANYLRLELDNLGFSDLFEHKKIMTWRKGNSMSKIDHIYTRLDCHKLLEITTDWTICDTDHSAVIAHFDHFRNTNKGVKPCRLSSEVVNNPELLAELKSYLQEQLQSLSSEANPHLILEFAKMTIRTKALQLGKKQISEEEAHLRFINDDIKAHENLLHRTHTAEDQLEINLIIQTRINERNDILEKQGKRLALKARSKWYNEGEKSNKYFLNLLKIGSSKNEMNALNIEGTLTTNSDKINEEVNNYYRKLYNNNPIIEENNDFLKEMFAIDRALSSSLNKPITLNELWIALKPLKNTAPGPDGISHLYLKKLWQIIGPIILNAWHYSIQKNEMPPSHYLSYLKLIPKAGKDKTELKNWRPITLSNCDHKLITRIYNCRLLQIISDKITKTQTAYIRNRNITDNIRMVNAAIQLSQHEPQINGTVIALDAQKAFDTVNHCYLETVLTKICLPNFIPILKLLYKGIKNDILINGKVSGSHYITNGVKQGDALSCTLFLLAIEPLIRNVQKSQNIKPIVSRRLTHTWPKVYAYADDITCVMNNDSESKQALFAEYEIFTKHSGLYLNADKTEIYEFGVSTCPNLAPRISHIRYMNTNYALTSLPEIKMNGITLCQNLGRFKEINVNALIDKMDRHFNQWSKRNLSLLGKIQIYKTFGLSQFLYHLSVLEPSLAMWKAIENKINKFLWNKNYQSNMAPSRIKKTTVNAPIHKGGFGMVDIKQVVAALRPRRHFKFLVNDVHPLHGLINNLIDTEDYLSNFIELDIDEITKMNLNLLQLKRLKYYESPEWQLESDLVLQAGLLRTKIENIVRPRKINSREHAMLRRLGLLRLEDVLLEGRTHIYKLINISRIELKKIIAIMARINHATNAVLPLTKLRNRDGSWVDAEILTSKKIRDNLFTHVDLVQPKITIMDDYHLINLYKRIDKLVNILNKTKMLRLIHGDVYSADRRARFGLTDSDICRRCFMRETILHLLTECPYTLEVYHLLGLQNINQNDILGPLLAINAFEIRADIIISLVFRLQIMPPEVLIKTTFEKYAKGLAYKEKIKKYAETQFRNY